ncbi:TlpA family protein disulfide reductase [Stenotrophomonas mori]|uniref:TlpA family protein disulfide reductase n=1 Tax=Stenotrophomonas mori TaxID=2871096 RepID=A0ABT0SHN8_9GAMM|nr:TlpA disulfide reductase family protein [Stenotrophomonas mori]MCL7714515.1 TlpA family protein disulfide reductase [Stenotrophomonas mori]
MRRASWWVAGLAAAAGLAAGAWLSRPPAPAHAAMTDTDSAVAPALAPGAPMPHFALPDLDGTLVQFPGQFAGRPLLINVWASWCAPCVEEMPELARFAALQDDTGPQVVGLALDSADAVRGFLQRVPVGYPIVLDTPGPRDASVALGNTRGLLPYSLLVDAQGRVRKQKLGPFKAGEIEHWAAPADPRPAPATP